MNRKPTVGGWIATWVIVLLLVSSAIAVNRWLASRDNGPSLTVAKQYPEYTTRVTFVFDSHIYTYYVQPSQGWKLDGGALILSDYATFDRTHADNQKGQVLTVSAGTAWWMKENARDEVK